MKPSSLFATKTWKGDYFHFLQSAFEDKWKDCKYDFDDKWLMINNGVPKDTLKGIEVAPLVDEVLDFFKLKRDDFKDNGYDGFYYSIAELTAIYLAKDFDYLCWIQGDCRLSKPYDWVTPGIESLKKEDISVVAPFSEVNTWHDKDGLDHFFSDQAFLIKVDEFRKPIYGIKGYMKEYPIYGGNYFEMMVGKYLHKENKYRKIITEAYYDHEVY